MSVKLWLTSMIYCSVLLSESLPYGSAVYFCMFTLCNCAWVLRGGPWVTHTLCCFFPLQTVTGWLYNGCVCVVHHRGIWGSLLPPRQLLCCAVSLLGYQMAHKQVYCHSWDSGGGNYGTAVKGRGEGRGGQEWELLVSTLLRDMSVFLADWGFADWEYLSVANRASQICSHCGIHIHMHVNKLEPKEVMIFKLVEQTGDKV